jgi:enediyne biosynthesis protein E4
MVAFLRTSTLLVVCLCLSGCGSSRKPRPADDAAGATGAGVEWFTERAQASGLDFVHFNGMSGELYYPEIMAPGVALLDYDNDGDLDVYVVQGQMLGSKPVTQATFPPSGVLKDRLFRNDLVVNADGTRTIHFTDVSDQSGINIQSYGMGVAVGDFNNDGFVDIYRTSLSGSVMLRNNGDGTFTDVTKQTGTEDRGGWGVSAAFVDYDRDGWLDLFVGNYLIYSLESDVHCLSVTGQRDYCPPNSYRPQPSRLYHNRGNGTFEDVTPRALVGSAYGPALGVSTADFNGDGWIDIHVANDSMPSQLWINQHDGTFKDTGFLSGVAVNGAGNSEARMGVDAGDFDNDGDEDLFITNWLDQMNILYANDGSGNFEDRKAASGLGPPSLAKTGFGTAWLDYDNDGWLDLLVTNGGVATIEAQARAKEPFPLRMTPQLYRNLGNGRFEDVSARAGAVFKVAEVGRGAAFGDIDNDGDTDVVIGNAAGRLRLLVNNVGNRSHWLGLRLVAAKAPRDAIGARVQIIRANQPALWRRSRSDGSYASANDPRVLVGLGASTETPRVRVLWPDGRTEEFASLPIDRYTTLKEGTGKGEASR